MSRLAGRIERRLLVNWRVDPDAIAALLPAGLRPQLVDGSAVAGVCALRVTRARPAGLPVGDPVPIVSTAHRVAVEWDDADGVRTGVHVAARHTRSRLAAALGGRLVPGVQQRARIDWRRGDVERVGLTAPGTTYRVAVAPRGPERSGLFPDLDDATAFFRGGEVAWSPDAHGALEPLRMRTPRWRLESLALQDAASSWIDALPAGSAVLDSAFLMRDVDVVWDRPALAMPAGGGVTATR